MTTPYDGCAHYKRKAKLLAPCCGEFIGCRFCHDEVHYEKNPDPKKAHRLDRHAVKTVQCMRCDTVQDAAQNCSSCGVVLGAYWCSVCVFLDDVDKGQYHCEKCGICRVGGREAYTHCDRCGACVKAATLDLHVCAKNAGLADCSVCLESLHTFRVPTQFLPCGHGLHEHCLRSFLESGQSTCPLCKKSVVPSTAQQSIVEAMDLEVARTPMPDEYRRKQVRVRCYECRNESDTLFHVVGYKCRAPGASCGGSYNTVKIGEAPDAEEVAPPSQTPDTFEALLEALLDSMERLEESEDE